MKAPQTGFWSGILATGAMTFALFKLRELLPVPKEAPLPPATITEDIAGPAGVTDAFSPARKSDLTMISHFGYGVACAELFALIQRRVEAPPIGAGMLYGVAVWTGSYFGLLPALGSRASAPRLRSATNLQMFVAHLVWGASLGYAEKELRRKGSSFLQAR